MNKELVIGGILVVAAAIALFVFKGPSENDVKQEKAAPAKVEQQAEQAKKAVPEAKSDVSVAKKQPGSVLTEEDVEPVADADEDMEDMEGLVKVVNQPEMPVVKVNDVEVSLNTVIPPGFMEPGDPVAQAGYDSFVNMAIDRALVVQKAEEMGVMSKEDFQAVRDNIRNELVETDPSESKEEIDWEANYIATSAVVNEVYKKEGLMPRRVTDEEVEEYYNNRSPEYEWLRERERNRGTSEDKIEKRVKEQIKRDIRDPINREIREKQRAYLDGLRDQANIEYLQDDAGSNLR